MLELDPATIGRKQCSYVRGDSDIKHSYVMSTDYSIAVTMAVTLSSGVIVHAGSDSCFYHDKFAFNRISENDTILQVEIILFQIN